MTDREEDIAKIDEQIKAWQRRLQKLEVKVALEGRNASPEDQIEIEDIHARIAELGQEHDALLIVDRALPAEQAAALQRAQTDLDKRNREPLDVKAEFVNREAELRDILGPFSKSYIFISAPAGFGKTYLLEEIQRRINVEPGSTQWLVLQHHCRANEGVDLILADLAWQLGHREPTAGLPDFLALMGRTLSSQAAIGVTILFDAVENWRHTANGTVQWSATALFMQSTFAQMLDESIHLIGLNLRVIFAGRYITSYFDEFRLPYQHLALKPFDRPVIYTFILETQRRYETIRKMKLDYSPQKIEDLAQEVVEITGGHPRAAFRLVHDIAERGFAIPPSMYFSPDQLPGLFERFVSQEIPELFKGIPLDLQMLFRTLSVFRGFNSDTLRALLDRNFIAVDDHADSWKLYMQVLGTHLVEASGPLAHDRILQRVLDIQLRFDNSARYRTLQQFAADLYDQWLQGLSHNGEKLDGGIPAGTDQVQFIVESIYHTCRAISQTMIGEILTRKMEIYLGRLRYPGGVLAGQRALKQAIEKDEQLPNLLRRGLGEQAYRAFLDQSFNGA